MHARAALTRLLVLALWAGLAAHSWGRQILGHLEPQGEKLVLTCPFESIPSWAFLPVEIQAENPGKHPADWRISTSTRNYMTQATIRSGVDFRAIPRDATHGSAIIPVGTVNDGGSSGSTYNMIEASLAGGSSGRGNISSHYSSTVDNRQCILISPTANRSISFTGTRFAPEQSPADWRAYCGFHSLYITAPEWQAMNPAARTAINHWTRLGGHLTLVKLDSNISGAATAGPTPESNLADAGFLKPDSGQDSGAVSRGRVEALSPTDLQQRDRQKNNTVRTTDWVIAATSGESVREWEQRDKAAFAVPSAGLAGGFMLVVLVVFAILVGPLNVFVLASARRRHRLFFTTPLISLVAGGLLVGSVILSDGIGGAGVRYTWLESGPAGSNTNYLAQHQHSRCGAMFTTGFEIPEDAFFAPMVLSNDGLSGNLSVDLQPGKVSASGPWFSSRRSQNFYLSAARPSRGRIAKSGPDDHPSLTSAFDFPIERVFWLAPDGKSWWQAAALAQGTATPMHPCTETEVQQALAAATAQAPPEYARDLAKASRRAGHFLAFASRISAIETHKSIRWKTHGFVTGPTI